MLQRAYEAGSIYSKWTQRPKADLLTLSILSNGPKSSGSFVRPLRPIHSRHRHCPARVSGLGWLVGFGLGEAHPFKSARADALTPSVHFENHRVVENCRFRQSPHPVSECFHLDVPELCLPWFPS